ncbi:hypothetical protein [Melittangium boletus]|uniref:Uncharacterized protein n=1 Tax=Melittangium boletus DSM 14713 TaxID=1294270 RepID=A0A250ID79_9BACT|nr:hypothetical protein [Melittangium boletus]ATB29799.1 hypothetical protein MEBOL_003254 [Melittangium boletus DSM 14713]
MTTTNKDFVALRDELASWPAESSSDAHGVQAPAEREVYAPATHSAALDPASTIVQGSRGTGKSFWAGVLGDPSLRAATAKAYPRLGLDQLDVRFGYTGLAGPEGVDKEKLDECVSPRAAIDEARVFWWATILRAIDSSVGRTARRPKEFLDVAANIEQREAMITAHARRLQAHGSTLLIVYDALDTLASSWKRRRMLTLALLEVVWAMRAWRAIRPKLFLRPDQLEDESLRFVELPKLRTGAVRLTWSGTDLYALFFARLSTGHAADSFKRLLASLSLPWVPYDQILARQWPLAHDEQSQRRLMAALAGAHMAPGPHGHKKGNTYDWPLKHLGDAFDEVTPRSFLSLSIGAAKYGESPPEDRVITPEGIRHGLRAASKMRVDQLHDEFPWIKGVLAPLAGLLLPCDEKEVFKVWKKAKTVSEAVESAKRHGYLPPFPEQEDADERNLYMALKRIGVMFRRQDERLDMPDLFRVAAKLLKKGGTAPL